MLLASALLLLAPMKWTAATRGTLAAISAAPGWHEIPNTKLRPLCNLDAPWQGTTGCQALISAWNGGIADTARDRLIFFGGGHFDYYGNEMYALEMGDASLHRLTEPSPITNLATCPEAYVDDTPAARHTYNGLTYVVSMNSIYLFGGAKSPCGQMSNATWTFDLGSSKWARHTPRGTIPAATPGVMADYDPVTDEVFVMDTQGIFSYDPRADLYVKLKSYYGVDYHLTGIVDPVRRDFVMAGGDAQFWSIDIRMKSKYELIDLAARQHGCGGLIHAAYPGLAYDAKAKAVIGWAGGNDIYVVRPESGSCDVISYPDGPGIAQANGTMGRFRYFPNLDVFVVVNDWDQNAFVLRLAPADTDLGGRKP